MNTPVIPKRQQKHSLSAKKTPIKGLRNVLAQPQDNYWPLVNTENSSVLEDLVKRLTTPMKKPSVTIPWSQLRHMKKEERAKVKKDALSQQKEVPDKDIINSTVVGINAVTRSLERNDICCILLDANIDPPLLIKHIVLMAQNKKVPLLLLPSLKKTTLHSIGFPAAAFALKNLVTESTDHHFHSLYARICDVFKDIPVPKHSLQLFKDIETLEDTMLDDDSEMETQNEAKITSSEPTKFTLSTNVYKYRLSCKERAFVPPSAKEKSGVEKVPCNDFISISNYESDDEDTSTVGKNTRYINIHENVDKKCISERQPQFRFSKNEPISRDADLIKLETDSEVTNVKYLPLKVKRLQGNNNRVKAMKISKQKKK